MRRVKLLHTSDFHIDWPFEMFAEGARQQRRKDLFSAFEYLCDLAVSEEVQGLVVAGDLFHSDLVDRHTVSLVVSGFMRLMAEGIKVVILPGNHDPGIEGLLRKNSGLLPNVFVFSGGDWQEYKGIEGVTVYGIPFNESRKNERVLANFRSGGENACPDDSGAPYRVGLLHGTVNGLPHIEGEYFPVTGDDIKNSGLDYLAMGHFHNFRDCSCGSTLSFYPGSPERLSFNNISDRKAIIVELKNGKVDAVPVTIPTRPYIVVDFDMNREGLANLYLKLNQWADSTSFIRLNITGLLDQQDVFSAERIEQQYKDKFFHLEICDFTRLIPQVDPNDKTVKGIFLRKISARLADSRISDDERNVLNEALKVGLTVLEGGKL
ncbi:MAG: metallophosphoesterase family protein [Eubacteriales bacterium]